MSTIPFLPFQPPDLSESLDKASARGQNPCKPGPRDTAKCSGKPTFCMEMAKETMVEGCKHQQVRVVSRNDDAEFVECVQCGEVFDAEEFEDMRIEEALQKDQDADA